MIFEIFRRLGWNSLARRGSEAGSQGLDAAVGGGEITGQKEGGGGQDRGARKQGGEADRGHCFVRRHGSSR